MVAVQCIYCLEDKPASGFSGREHVIPQAFGRFDTNNLVLRCVCDDCNGYFGRGIDQKLARDSAEAIDRINRGLKSARDYQSAGRQSTSYVEFADGPMSGGRGYAVASQDSRDTLGVKGFPQVWFGKSEGGPFDKFTIENVPDVDELAARGYAKGSALHVKTFEIDDPSTLLKSKGFNVENTDWGEPVRPHGEVRIENVTRIAEPEFRAATKISLNYLAAVVGHDRARTPAFDEARNFARYGSEKARVRVHPFENPWFIGRNGHYVSLGRFEEMTVVQLSLLLRIQYFVVLSDDASVSVPATAHFFDLATNHLEEIEPLTLRPGRPLKPIA